MTLPKWNDERTAELTALVGDESPVSKATVAAVAEKLETSPRSVSSKLRKLGIEVELASAAPKAFTDEEAEALRDFVEDNEGNLTYAEIAASFADGKFGARAVQGKILSMELTGSVKATPRPETTKTYTDAEQEIVQSMVNSGKFVEEIADKLGKSVASVRGKALSLLRDGSITEMPKQRDVKGQAPDSLDSLGDVSGLTVAEIAEKLEKTERGVKTMLTRRGVTAKDYDGAAKAAKKAAE
jgi:DNA-binding CsgD family transcriptional regulator